MPWYTRLVLATFVALIVAEGVVLQPVRFWGPTLASEPTHFARLVDLFRAAIWVGTTIVTAVGFWAGSASGLPTRSDRQQRWLWNMLDTFSEGMVAFDHGGRVAFVNQAALGMLGRRALPNGTPMAAFADFPRLRTTVAHALLDGRMETVEVRSVNRTLLARAAPCDDGALLLLVDVSSERAAIESREAFLSDAAHELRTPVAAIGMGLEALDMGGLAEPERARQLLAGVERHNARMAQLLEDLLSLARLESGAEDVDLVALELVETVAAAIEALDEEERVTLRGPEVVWVIADELAVYRVVDNLVANALRYSQGPVEVTLTHAGDRVRLEVTDSGPGLPDALKERVFERFFRVDTARTRRAGGTGLGLAIVRELVERLDGRVWVEDAASGGARFVVTLRPVAEDPSYQGGGSSSSMLLRAQASIAASSMGASGGTSPGSP